MLKLDAALGNRLSSITHTRSGVVESACQANCNQGVCNGADEGKVKSVLMVAYCLSVISQACSLLYKQIAVSQLDILSPSRHSFNHDYWFSCAYSSHISSRKRSCSDFFVSNTYELWVSLP